MKTQIAPFTADNSKPAIAPPIPDGEAVSPWIGCGYGQEQRRKVIYKTRFIDYTNSYTGKRSQWWNQDQRHYTQKRDIGDLNNRLVEYDIWHEQRCDAQGLGIEAI